MGVEKELIAEYVETGQVKYIFWPVVNHGQASFNAMLVMECAGQQSPELAWTIHDILFENHSSLYSAGLDLYMNIAGQAGLDLDAFQTCFGSDGAIAQIRSLDQTRIDKGITGQPVFEFVGVGYLIGSQPKGVFDDAILTVQGQ
ncbi:MAG: protein-disulfide isomerase [Cellvibrionaceae bacterium]|jgi:protein-disulfide isomerase